MTLQELYAAIDGDYDQAIRTLRVEKLIDKHIRRLPGNPIFSDLADAGTGLDGTRLFESAHAMKGVASNLGLVRIAALAEEVCNEFRPGNPRRFTDDEVRQRIAAIGEAYQKAAEDIRRYEQSAQ